MAQILTKVIGFFYTIFLAKSLGVEDFGLFSVALAYFSIISAFTDFGFNRYLIREVSRDKGNISEILCNVAILRLTLASVFFGIFAVALYILDPDKIRVSLILIAALAILPGSIALTFDGIFVALQKLQFSAIALTCASLTNVLFGFYFISQSAGSIGVVDALVISQLVYVLVLFIFLLNHKILPISLVTIPVLKKALAGSLPYGILAVLGLLYFRIDTVLLSYLKGNFEAGIYGVSYKFLEVVTLIPSAFSLALFPVFARIHESSSPAFELKKLYFKSIKIMFGLGLLVFLGYVFILPEIIKMILPKYLTSISAIRILSLSVPFMFIHIPGATVLLSSDKYLKQVLFLSIVTVLFNIIGNLLFIPNFGFIAASWMTVASEILSFLAFFVLLKIKILDKF